MNKDIIKFEYNDYDPNLTMDDDMIAELKAEDWSDEDILDEAYNLFMDDDGNTFSLAEIDKGIVYEYDTLWDFIINVKTYEEAPKLIKDFRDFVKADAYANHRNSNYCGVSIYYDKRAGSFFKNEALGKHPKLLTLTEQEYEGVFNIVYALHYEDPKTYDIAENDYDFINRILDIDDNFLNLENIEKRLRKIIREVNK